MNSLTAVTLALCVSSILAEGHFCYRDDEGCGPSTAEWPPLCHDGERQSPIEIPADIASSGRANLRLHGAYRNSFFRLSNNGHSANFDFVGESGENEGPTSEIFRFPLNIQGEDQDYQDFKFAGGHFHWGPNSTEEGSEHCVGTRCYAMELHLVHYSTNYSSLTEAVTSGDGNALAVLGLFIDVQRIAFTGNRQVRPILRNLHKVREANSETIRVDEELDFSKLLNSGFRQEVYTYKGSLTTPGCAEKVNWFVLKNPAKITLNDVRVFRATLLDSRGEPMDINFRPVQPLKEREVLLTPVRATA